MRFELFNTSCLQANEDLRLVETPRAAGPKAQVRKLFTGICSFRLQSGYFYHITEFFPRKSQITFYLDAGLNWAISEVQWHQTRAH